MSAKSEKWKNENDFYINNKTHKVQYNKKCITCTEECKQSFKANVMHCKNFKQRMCRNEL